MSGLQPHCGKAIGKVCKDRDDLRHQRRKRHTASKTLSPFWAKWGRFDALPQLVPTERLPHHVICTSNWLWLPLSGPTISQGWACKCAKRHRSCFRTCLFLSRPSPSVPYRKVALSTLSRPLLTQPRDHCYCCHRLLLLRVQRLLPRYMPLMNIYLPLNQPMKSCLTDRALLLFESFIRRPRQLVFPY